jgi:molybdenum cofactor guanylyltransferase
MEDVAGIVLAGGRSSRMGSAKAALEWHGSTLLRRVTGLVGRAVGGPVVVVRAPGQELPPLPAEVEVAEDAHEGRGPLEGLAAGLAALAGRAQAAYVSSTDVPLLHPAFVRAVAAALDEADVALPVVHGHPQPLAAAYRLTLLPLLTELLAADRLKPANLFDRCRVRRLDERALLADRRLAAADPELLSVLNVNEPADLESARARPAPTVTVERVRVQAATLGAAAAAAGLELGQHVVIDGDRIATDPELPLAEGDQVALSLGPAPGPCTR